MAMGPVQVLIVGFGEDAEFKGEALDQLRLLREQDIVRVIDLLVVHHKEDGTVEKLEIADHEELADLGALAGALIGVESVTAEGLKAVHKNFNQAGEAMAKQGLKFFYHIHGYEFRPQFFAEVKENFGAAPEIVDFAQDASAATRKINDWVAQQTRDRIRDLIPQPLVPATRLVLANALYLKAPWASEFSADATKPAPFHIRGRDAVDLPTMQKLAQLRYAKRKGFAAVALPYSGDDLQFVVLIPDEVDGLGGLEKQLTADLLGDCAKMNASEVLLHLPKFKFEPPTIQLAAELQDLGMKTAFDIPPGSANFDRMAPRKPNDYLAISDVFHRTFIALDEKGTEAAAATAVAMVRTTAMRPTPPKPIEVKVDRPFIYAIQHVPSGACLFLGCITDPR
jgi:serpin B